MDSSYELRCGYKPNVSYLKLFGSKCYIFKESRKGKIDVKGDEGIFLGYSCKSKAYRCLNFSTHKIIGSAHVKVDEFVERTEEESKKEPEDYKRFVYIKLDTLPETSVNKETSTPESSSVIKLQEVQINSQGPESHFEATKPMPTESEQPKPGLEIQNEDNWIQLKGKEPTLAKYVRRHHAPDQIIRDKLEGTMTRSKLKAHVYLLILNLEVLKVHLKMKVGLRLWMKKLNK